MPGYNIDEMTDLRLGCCAMESSMIFSKCEGKDKLPSQCLPLPFFSLRHCRHVQVD